MSCCRSLKQDWNPRLTEALAHLADLAYEEERWWAAEIARLARDMLAVSPGAVEVSAQANWPGCLARWRGG